MRLRGRVPEATGTCTRVHIGHASNRRTRVELEDVDWRTRALLEEATRRRPSVEVGEVVAEVADDRAEAGADKCLVRAPGCRSATWW